MGAADMEHGGRLRIEVLVHYRSTDGHLRIEVTCPGHAPNVLDVIVDDTAEAAEAIAIVLARARKLIERELDPVARAA